MSPLVGTGKPCVEYFIGLVCCLLGIHSRTGWYIILYSHR